MLNHLRSSMTKLSKGAALCLLALLVLPSWVAAQESTEPGVVLPDRRPAEFKGTIGETYKDSKPDFPTTREAPEGAPNVLLILLDDVVFGASSTFGGPIPTPALDQLASEGLRYTQWHTTALCSPTRAAILTGMNHHEAGFGVISEIATGFPGYNAILPDTSATRFKPCAGSNECATPLLGTIQLKELQVTTHVAGLVSSFERVAAQQRE